MRVQRKEKLSQELKTPKSTAPKKSYTQPLERFASEQSLFMSCFEVI
jgi:hypothetical protein